MDPHQAGNQQWPNVAPSPQQQQQQQQQPNQQHFNLGQGGMNQFQQQQQQLQFQALQQQMFEQQQQSGNAGNGSHFAQQQQQSQQQQPPSQQQFPQFSGIPAHLLQGLANQSSPRTASPQSLSQLQLLQATQQYQQQQQLGMGNAPGQPAFTFNQQGQPVQRPPSSASVGRSRQASSSSNAGGPYPQAGSPALSHASVASPLSQSRPNPMMGMSALGNGQPNGVGGMDPSALLGRGSPSGIDRALSSASNRSISGDFNGQQQPQQQQQHVASSMTPESLARQQQMMAAALKARNQQFQQQFDANGNQHQQQKAMSQLSQSPSAFNPSQLPNYQHQQPQQQQQQPSLSPQPPQQPQQQQKPSQQQQQQHGTPQPTNTVTPGPSGTPARKPMPFLAPNGLPNVNTTLAPFIAPEHLPTQFRPWANHPAALQFLSQKNPTFANYVASKMGELGRGGEGLPGMPGTIGNGRGSITVPPPSPAPNQLPSQAQQAQPSWAAQQQQQQQQLQAAQQQQHQFQTPRQPAQPQLPQLPTPSQAQNSPGQQATPGAQSRPQSAQQPRRESSEQAQTNGWQQAAQMSLSLQQQQQQQQQPALDGRPSSRGSMSMDFLRPQTGSPSMQPPSRMGASASPHPPPAPIKIESSPAPVLPLAPVLPEPPATSSSTPTTSAAPTATLTPTASAEVSAMSEHALANVRLWKARDEAYVQSVEKDQKRQQALVNGLRTRPGGLAKPHWWEVDGSEAKRRREPIEEQRSLGFEWPSVKRSKWEKTLGRTQIKFSRNQLKQAAKVEEQLIPIRLEIDSEPFRFRDTFTWNASDPVVTPELFAQNLVEDFHLPPMLLSRIVTSIQEQITSYQTIASAATLPKSSVKTGAANAEEGDDPWWDRWRDSVDRARSRRKGKGRELDFDFGRRSDDSHADERAMTLDEIARAAATSKTIAVDDMRILIKLDITVGTLNLTDAFEWDISETDAAAEQFAEIYAADLGLAGEFKTAIAHDIREQSQIYLRSLILVGHPFDGTPVLDDDLRVAFLPPVVSVVRTEDVANASYTPMFEKLDEAMIERREKEREKELKRKKRQTKGRRGVALPDREPKPSKRTVPSLGGVDANGVPIPAPDAPGVESTIQDAPPPSLRRAAAVAASASITQHATEDSQRSPPPSRSLSPEPQPHRHPAFKTQTPVPKLPTPIPPSPARSSPPPTPVRSHKKRSHHKKPVSKVSSRNETPRASTRGASTPMRTDVKQEDADYDMDGRENRSPSKSPQVSTREPSPRKSNRLSPDKPEAATANGLIKKEPTGGPTPSRTAEGSPLSFHDVASPDSLSSLSDGDDPMSDPSPKSPRAPSPDPAAAKPQQSIAPARPPLPASVSSELSVASATPAPGVDAPSPPAWITNAAAELRAKYRDDRFQIIPKFKRPPGSSPDGPPDWRIKCNDCPGRIYDPGPGPLLDNFTVHLNNRNHRTNVSNRLVQEQHGRRGGGKE